MHDLKESLASVGRLEAWCAVNLDIPPAARSDEDSKQGLDRVSKERLISTVHEMQKRKDELTQQSTAVREAYADQFSKEATTLRATAAHKARSLSDRITVLKSVNQFDEWSSAPSFAPDDILATGVFKTMEIRKKRSEELARIVEDLMSVPRATPLDVKYRHASSTPMLLAIVLVHMQGCLTDRLAVINAMASEFHVHEDLRQHEGAVLESHRGAVDICDAWVHYQELLDDLVGQSGRQLTILHSAMVRLSAAWMALDYSQKVIAAQANQAASMADVEADPNIATHLRQTVSPNLGVLSRLLQSAIEHVRFGIPYNPTAQTEALSGAALESDAREWDWKNNKKKEMTELYGKLVVLQPAFLEASEKLRRLALRLHSSGRAKNKQPQQDLAALAQDLRIAADQISEHLSELVEMMPGLQRMRGTRLTELEALSWPEPDVAGPNNESVVPDDSRKARRVAQETAPAEPESAAKASRLAQASDAPGDIFERRRKKFDALGEEASRLINHAHACIAELKGGSVRLKASSANVETLWNLALECKAKQLRLLSTIPGMEGDSDLKTRRKKLQARLTKLKRESELQFAEAVSLRPTAKGIMSARERGLKIRCERPLLLGPTQRGDYVHRYVVHIEGFRCNLHAHSESDKLLPVANPTVIHYKRIDEGGIDDEKPRYYQQERLSKEVFRGKENKEGLEFIQSLLKPEERTPIRPRQ